jgi:hypothetical protein
VRVDVDGWYGGWEKADIRVVSRKSTRRPCCRIGVFGNGAEMMDTWVVGGGVGRWNDNHLFDPVASRRRGGGGGDECR